MSEKNDDVEKNEAPTAHRREKARQDGTIPRSKELASVLILLMGWLLLYLGGNQTVKHLTYLLRHGLHFNYTIISDINGMYYHIYHLLKMMMSALLPVIPGIFITAILSPLLLGGLHLSTKSIKIDLKRLSPLSGIKRLFSPRIVIELVKATGKISLVAAASSLFFIQHKTHFIQLLHQPLVPALADALTLILDNIFLVIIFLIPIAGYDICYQLIAHFKKLRMSRQEIRDELKQHEGDPHTKGRIRQLQQDAARQRMMSDIPHADVIVSNPTHYTVALSYKSKDMSVPIVLAKGAGDIALRIRELGQLHAIPMLEAPPLARVLYRHCELGEPIPVPLYSAVAQVLVWVHGIKHWHHYGGIKPTPPNDIPVPPNMDFKPESKS